MDYTETKETLARIDKVMDFYFARYNANPNRANRTKYYRWLHLSTVAFRIYQAHWGAYVR